MKKITLFIIILFSTILNCSAQYRIQFFAARKVRDVANPTHYFVRMPPNSNNLSPFYQADNETNEIVRFVSYTEFAEYSTAKAFLKFYQADFPTAFVISVKKLSNLKLVK